jgi:HEAT repeat protein
MQIVIALLVSALLHASLTMDAANQTYSAPPKGPTERALADVTMHRSVITPAALQALLIGALQDPSPQVREAALLAIVSRAGAPRFARTAEITAQWREEYPLLQALRSRVRTATSDPDVRVRRAALLALGNLDYAGKPDSETPISNETLGVLRAMFMSNEDQKIRQEIMKAVALKPNPEAAIDDIVRIGIDDGSAGVRQYAVFAAARVRSASLLSQVATKLTDADTGVRLAAASALERYGPPAKAYLAQLRDASRLESDPRTRQLMERVIREWEK